MKENPHPARTRPAWSAVRLRTRSRCEATRTVLPARPVDGAHARPWQVATPRSVVWLYSARIELRPLASLEANRTDGYDVSIPAEL